MKLPNNAVCPISVVVPTLDEEQRIGACLRSIGTQPGVEIVVSDGGSTDKTLEVVRELDGQTRIVGGVAGRGGQLNRGAAEASADRLLFLHADCLLPEGWFDGVMDALDDETVSLAAFGLHTEPSGGKVPGAWGRFWLSLFDLRSRGWGLPYGDQGFAMRRSVFNVIGGFPDIPLMEDFAMARLCRRHGVIRHIPSVIRTTARRYEGMPIRSRLILAFFPTLFRLGVSPRVLANWYGVVR